jgi:hypothetical protein
LSRRCCRRAAEAANFTCSWNDATASWTTAADWSNCNGTFPNNGSGNAFDATIAQGNPTLTTTITIGSVTITSPGAWSTAGAGSATLTGDVANAGVLNVDIGNSDGGGNLTITGTLANIKTVQVGSANPNFPAGAANTLTVGALTNASGASFSMIGSSSQKVTLAFTGAGFSQNDGSFGLVNITPLTLNNSFTNSSTGTFRLGAIAPVTVSGNFTNAGVLNVDIGNSDGGGNLTITGTLANTKTVQVGSANPAFPAGAPNTLSLGALTNATAGTIDLFGNPSNAANTAKATVNGQASNAGTVNIRTNTSVTVTGAGNAYTQNDGFTNLSGGALAAPNVNITGGTLRGSGTVTGATSISGAGTIQALNIANNSLAAVLTIDGNYFQSGGTFSELLHGTGVQLDKVDVTAGHTITLTGGNLQVSGVTFALGQMFNNIITFQPGGLSGTFSHLQGGGDGTTVNLGGGLILKALYNNLAGNISLEVDKGGSGSMANPSIMPTTIDFGNVRINTLQQQALTVTNVAGTPPQESLDAQISAGLPATSNNGKISLLAPGATDKTSLVAGLDTANAGAQTGHATVALQSNSTPLGCTSNCITSLASQDPSW